MSFAIRKLRLAEEDALDAAIWYTIREIRVKMFSDERMEYPIPRVGL